MLSTNMDKDNQNLPESRAKARTAETRSPTEERGGAEDWPKIAEAPGAVFPGPLLFLPYFFGGIPGEGPLLFTVSKEAYLGRKSKAKGLVSIYEE